MKPTSLALTTFGILVAVTGCAAGGPGDRHGGKASEPVLVPAPPECVIVHTPDGPVAVPGRESGQPAIGR